MKPKQEPKQEGEKNECTLSDLELIDACNKWVSKLCETGGHAWCLRVPADLNNDPDLLFVELANRFKSKLTPAEPKEVKPEDWIGNPKHIEYWKEMSESLLEQLKLRDGMIKTLMGRAAEPHIQRHD